MDILHDTAGAQMVRGSVEGSCGRGTGGGVGHGHTTRYGWGPDGTWFSGRIYSGELDVE